MNCGGRKEKIQTVDVYDLQNIIFYEDFCFGKQQLQQQKEHLMLDRLQMAFRRSENQLINVLEKRKGEVKVSLD